MFERYARKCFCCGRNESDDNVVVLKKKMCVHCIKKVEEIKKQGWVLVPRKAKE
jgi:hypothetical protein